MKKILFIAASLWAISAVAQDRVFTYTYQSNVLNKGQKELEVWSTLGTGRQDYYRGLKHSLEFEIGLGSNLQTSFYLNYGYSKGIANENGIQVLNSENSYSFSNEWKLKLSDPVASKLGTALYFEYELAPDETAFEGKLILDKQSGKFLNAFNLVGEYVIGKKFLPAGNLLNAANENEFNLELNYGWSYKISDHWNAGLEAMNQNVLTESKLAYSILTAGPVVSYSTNGFWVNLGVMPQLANLKGGGRDLIDHNGLQARLIFSYEF